MRTHRLSFVGFPVDALTTQDVLDFVLNSIRLDEQHYLVVQNANKMYLSKKFSELEDIIENASVILPEHAINMGMAFLGQRLPERNMGGINMMERLLKLANSKSYSIYLLGASQPTLNVLVQKIRKNYGSLRLVGSSNGFFDDKETERVVSEIASKKPNFLFVGMGSPRQEFFIGRNYRRLGANIAIGVGGSFNVLAGLEKSAPAWSKYGFEWLYRSVIDPKKFQRYMIVNSFFAYRFLRYLLLKR